MSALHTTLLNMPLYRWKAFWAILHKNIFLNIVKNVAIYLVKYFTDHSNPALCDRTHMHRNSFIEIDHVNSVTPP